LFMKKMGSKHVIYETLCTRFENDPLAFYDDQGKFDQSKLYALMVHELTSMLNETKKSEPIHFEISKIIDFYAEEQRVTPPTPAMQQLPLDPDVNVQVPVTQKVNNQRSKSPTETQAPKPQYIQFAYGDTTREIFYQDLKTVLDLGRKLEATGAGNDEESLLELKHNIIEFCVRLHAIKKSVPAFYHAMISTFPNTLDPVSVIRHGAVHHDLLISTEEKFPFYRAIAQQLVQITRLHTPGAELKANDLVIKALEKSDTFPLSFRHCGEMYTRFESEALVWRDEPVQNKLAPEHLEDRIRSRMEFISSDASKIAITMAIVELGEIFSQLRNHGSLDQISVHKKTVGKCIEIRNKAVHGAELGDAVDKLLSQVLNGKSPRSEG
jgi:hypothetical protein